MGTEVDELKQECPHISVTLQRNFECHTRLIGRNLTSASVYLAEVWQEVESSSSLVRQLFVGSGLLQKISPFFSIHSYILPVSYSKSADVLTHPVPPFQFRLPTFLSPCGFALNIFLVSTYKCIMNFKYILYKHLSF